MSEEETNQSAQTETENPIPNSISAPPSSQEPTAEVPIPPTEPVPAQTPPEAPQTSPNPEDAIPVRDVFPQMSRSISY